MQLKAKFQKLNGGFDMKKKFKVRVVHDSEGWYRVEYSYHYLIPFYFSIKKQFHPFTIDIDPSYETLMFNGPINAEIFASKLKSIADIRTYYAPMKEYEKDIIRQRKEYSQKRKQWYKENVPYETKQIK